MELVAVRTHTEAALHAFVNTFLVGRTRVRSGAVYRFDETVVVFTEKVWRTSTGVAIKTDEIARAVVIDAADDLFEAQLVWVALVAGRTVALRGVVFREADGVLATFVFERPSRRARV